MKLADWERWLVDEQWDGYRLDEIIFDTQPQAQGDEFVDLMNYAGALRSLFILVSGLGGEQGEATEHFKKWVRDGKLDKVEAATELGDVLAYLTWLTHALGLTLDDVAKLNYDKLIARGRKA